MNELILNIKKLEESGIFDELAQIEFKNWKASLEHEQAKEGLLNNLVVREWLEDCERQILGIESDLLSDKEMDSMVRNRLLDKRACYKGMIQKFKPNEVEIEEIKRGVEDNLTQI